MLRAMQRSDFKTQYGPWAVVAGASAGLGAEYAKQLAQKGLNLVLVARRAQVLESLAKELRERHGVEVRLAALDLGSPELLSGIRAATEGLDVGLLVYNAALSLIGRFFEQTLEEKLRVIDVNCR